MHHNRLVCQYSAAWQSAADLPIDQAGDGPRSRRVSAPMIPAFGYRISSDWQATRPSPARAVDAGRSNTDAFAFEIPALIQQLGLNPAGLARKRPNRPSPLPDRWKGRGAVVAVENLGMLQQLDVVPMPG